MSALQGRAHAQSSAQIRHGQAQGSNSAAPQHAEQAAAAAAAQAPGMAAEIERDADAEGELTSAARSDPFAAYDVDVALEGQAIREFTALLADDAG